MNTRSIITSSCSLIDPSVLDSVDVHADQREEGERGVFSRSRHISRTRDIEDRSIRQGICHIRERPAEEGVVGRGFRSGFVLGVENGGEGSSHLIAVLTLVWRDSLVFRYSINDRLSLWSEHGHCPPLPPRRLVQEKSLISRHQQFIGRRRGRIKLFNG